MVVNLSGRGDKDLTSVTDYLERRGTALHSSPSAGARRDQ
jgi:hypothetical protein